MDPRYSPRYSDDQYEYRHVILRPSSPYLIPRGRLLSEQEVKDLGIQQSKGWINYAVNRSEPNVLLFRRPKPDPQP